MTKLSTQPEEADLISGLLNRDVRAFSLLYDRYAAPLLGLICRIVKDDATAHSLLKTTFLFTNQHITEFDPARQRLFSWLTGIARQQALPYQKPDQAAIIMIGATAPKPANQQSLAEHVVEQQYVLGKTQQQVADALQVPLAVVRQQTRMGLIPY